MKKKWLIDKTINVKWIYQLISPKFVDQIWHSIKSYHGSIGHDRIYFNWYNNELFWKWLRLEMILNEMKIILVCISTLWHFGNIHTFLLIVMFLFFICKTRIVVTFELNKMVKEFCLLCPCFVGWLTCYHPLINSSYGIDIFKFL